MTSQNQKSIYQVYFTKNCLFVLNQNFHGIKSSLKSTDIPDDEEEKCNTCGKNIDDDDDTKKCGEGCPEYDEGWHTAPEE